MTSIGSAGRSKSITRHPGAGADSVRLVRHLSARLAAQLRQSESRHPENRHLLIAIGGHAGSGRKVGTLDFGPAARGVQ